jgi:uncharacterized protein
VAGVRWLNEPPSWQGDAARLQVRTGPGTDFWQRTHYGFERDDGHALIRRVDGDFVAEVGVEGHYREQYDQAGLLVRASATHWVKAGIEYVDGAQLASVVVTRGYSDWSTAPLVEPPERFRVRVVKDGPAVKVEGSTDGGTTWQLMRLAWLGDHTPLDVGPMCASPDGGGFDVTFHDFTLQPR